MNTTLVATWSYPNYTAEDRAFYQQLGGRFSNISREEVCINSMPSIGSLISLLISSFVRCTASTQRRTKSEGFVHRFAFVNFFLAFFDFRAIERYYFLMGLKW